MDVKPKKYLGQHFLIDNNIANKIVDALDMEKSNSLLEIGPGKGVLTQIIIDRNINPYYAIDVDSESVQYLKTSFEEIKDNIIEGDFLKDNVLEKLQKPVAIIGNLPYNISSQIMFKIIENIDQVNNVVCMIQKEVADRFVSKPNTKVYGILSVLLQAYFDVKYLFTVSENVFHPRPKVKSAVIRLTRKQNYELSCSESLFKEVIKAGFGKRRKTLRNSLKDLLQDISKEHELLSQRPEQLSVNDFIDLTNFVALNKKE